MLKRLFDLVLAFCGITLLFPLFLIISMIIFFEDFNSVFFIQKRVGIRGKLFRLYKFRTMSVLESRNSNKIVLGDNSRVTHIGKFLRKSKLDELPQLFNVIKGDMSIVGPRPEVPQFINNYPERWSNVLMIKPGITDYASIEFRNEEQILSKSDFPNKTYVEEILPMKLKLYEKYVKDHSFINDLKIIMKTIYVIFSKK